MTETPLWPDLQTPGPPPWPRRGRRARQRRRRLTIGIVAGVVSVMTVAGGAYAFGLFEQGAEVTAGPSAMARPGAAESASLRDDLVAEIASARKVLKGPDGEAAPQPERQALITAIDDAQRVVGSSASASTPPSGSGAEVADEGVRAATAALRTAVAAVVGSGQQVRLEQASSEVEAALAGLREAVAAGEEAYAASAEAVDQAGRDPLRAALDAAAEAEAPAADALTALADTAPGTASGSTPNPALPPKTVTDLLDRAGRAASALAEATVLVQDATATLVASADEADGEEGDAETPAAGTDPATGTETAAGPEPAAPAPEPAGTCPEADQVWSAENGHLSWSELAEIPFAPGHYVRADVVGKLAALNDAYVGEFGVNMTINSSYRTYEQQESLYDPSSKTAAPPGCSNHGTGLAVDIGGGVQTFGTAQYDWLKANGEALGWVHPPFAEPDGRNPEPWHWQSVLAPNSY